MNYSIIKIKDIIFISGSGFLQILSNIFSTNPTNTVDNLLKTQNLHPNQSI